MLAVASSDYRRDLHEIESSTNSEVDTDVLPEVTIPLIHIVYEKIRDRIAFVKEALPLGISLPQDHSTRLDKVLKNPKMLYTLKNAEFKLFESILEKCWTSVSRFLEEPDTSISFVYKYQHLIEENLSLLYKDFSKEDIFSRLVDPLNLLAFTYLYCVRAVCIGGIPCQTIQ